MAWTPPNEPVRYDRRRVATFEPVHAEIEQLKLPSLRSRKLNGIVNAIEMQIEDGGDSPEVNQLLLDALRAAVVHQVGDAAAARVLRAIATFQADEAARWKQVQAGTPPPLAWEDQLEDLVAAGYEALKQQDTQAACDQWLAAWEIVKRLARPELRDSSAFDAAHPHASFLSNWCQDLKQELRNAGYRNPRYWERRLQFAREFLAQFPDEIVELQLGFARAEGEALWELGRRNEADAVYAALVERLPDEAWSYIGWADRYWLWNDSPKEYARAQAIMERALPRPQLKQRRDLVERLRELYTESGQTAKLKELMQHDRPDPPRTVVIAPAPAFPTPAAPRAAKPGRNDPCWCGSGKKYKRCHLPADPR